MKSLRGWFNIYFISALALAVAGCGSMGYGKKQVATIRLYLESRRESSGAGTVYVTRQRIPMSIDREPFLDESDLSSARLDDNPDGTYAIELSFNDHGATVLDMTTVGNRGRRIVIFSHFPPPGTKEDANADIQHPDAGAPSDQPRKSGWISAVMINHRMSNGNVRFTPDATREEAAHIVEGLKNVIAKAKSKY
ncbi:MAG TPA: hypothetical protein VHB20_08845 [Verrucomicrobiae bacterium]|jgi:hypothetical protein|nr:hypothetical protein [Verrucomicrobiae bacterium]